jgi:hypothetical protein
MVALFLCFSTQKELLVMDKLHLQKEAEMAQQRVGQNLQTIEELKLRLGPCISNYFYYSKNLFERIQARTNALYSSQMRSVADCEGKCDGAVATGAQLDNFYKEAIIYAVLYELQHEPHTGKDGGC